MRRKSAPKREVMPDPMYGSKLLAKFINNVMIGGKKSVSEKIVYGALAVMAERIEKQAEFADERDGGGSDGDGGKAHILGVFDKALGKIRPRVEVKSRRVGGATYQVPVEVNAARSTALAMRWLIAASKKRHEKSMMLRLAGELLDALKGRGGAVKKCDEVIRMARANQAFAHYRW